MKEKYIFDLPRKQVGFLAISVSPLDSKHGLMIANLA